MAGHSKWANIKYRKSAADAKRGKVFTRLIKEITVASRQGGKDLNNNPRLRTATDKAREYNMPSDNIERAIKRGVGELEGVQYEEIRYEGYGPYGVPIIVDCLTDNRTRTVGDVRNAFVKNGGNLGTEGSVAYLFTYQGFIVLAPGADEAKVFEIAIEAGADDIMTQDDGSIDIVTLPEHYLAVTQALVQANIPMAFAELTLRPLNEIQIHEDGCQRVQKLIDTLESLDDVQNVYSAFTG